MRSKTTAHVSTMQKLGDGTWSTRWPRIMLHGHQMCVGNSLARFVDPYGMYRLDALGNMILSSAHEIAHFFKYVGRQGYSELNFEAFVKDPAKGFKIDLPIVYIDGSASSIRNMEKVQHLAADLYSYTHGNVYVGSGYSNLPTISTGRRVRSGILFPDFQSIYQYFINFKNQLRHS